MHINEETQKQLNNFDAFIKLMTDMGMAYDDYGRDTEAVKLEEIRGSIIEKHYSGIGHAEAYFKHPLANVWVHIECETPLYKFDQSKVRILVSEGRSYYGTRENPYRPLGKASTLKKRILERVETLVEVDAKNARREKFFTLNKPAAEKMIVGLTGEFPIVSEDKKGYQSVLISYRGIDVSVALSTLVQQGLDTEVALTIGFNSRNNSKRIKLEKWVEVVDQLKELDVLA